MSEKQISHAPTGEDSPILARLRKELDRSRLSGFTKRAFGQAMQAMPSQFATRAALGEITRPLLVSLPGCGAITAGEIMEWLEGFLRRYDDETARGDVTREVVLSADAMGDVVAIFLESNKEASLEDSVEFLAWVNRTRFMHRLLELCLARRARIYFRDGKMNFTLAK
jgi:hypothetical protein